MRIGVGRPVLLGLGGEVGLEVSAFAPLLAGALERVLLGRRDDGAVVILSRRLCATFTPCLVDDSFLSPKRTEWSDEGSASAAA